MSKKPHNREFKTLATFTVCADSELSSAALSAPSYVPGVEFAGDFQEYITGSRRPHFPASFRRVDSCVAFIDFDRDPEQAAETAAVLRSNPSPRILSVGVASRADAELLLRAMRAGCSEFLEKPIGALRLQETLQTIQNRLATSVAQPARHGQIVTFMGAKGGVGTTTLAVHLAICLAKKHKKKTLLIDHHHQLGHVCLYLGLKQGKYHFDEMIRNVERLDPDLLEGFVLKHPSGLEVVGSSDSVAPSFVSSREEIEHLFDFLREEYDFIVIDSSMKYGTITDSMVGLSDEVVLVATPDVASIRDLSRQIESLKLDDITAAKLRIVINRETSTCSIAPEEIVKALSVPMHLTFPNSYEELQRAMNTGEPVFSHRSAFAARMSKWSDKFVAEGETPESAPPKPKFAFWR